MTGHLLALAWLGIIMAGPLPTAAWIAARLEGPGQRAGFAQHLLVVALSWCVIQVSLGLLLGALHGMTLVAVLLAESALGVLGGLALRSNQRIHPRSIYRRPSGLSHQEQAVIGFIGCMGFLLLLNLMISPIRDYDSLTYHLPNMAEWMQSGTLTRLAQFKLIRYYPFNWEVLGTFFMMPFSGDFLATLPNLFAWGLLGLSVYLIGIRLGIQRIHALGASAILLTLPVVIGNVHTFHVDMAFAAFFCAGFYFAICQDRAEAAGYLPLFAAVLGMLIGIKTSGIVYGLILLTVLALQISRQGGKQGRAIGYFGKIGGRDMPIMIWGGLSMLWLGGFWFLRNWMEWGTLFGVIHLQVGSTVLLRGLVKPEQIFRTTLAGAFKLGDASHWRILLGQVKVQLGVPFLIMAAAVPGIFMRPGVGRKSRKSLEILLIFALMAVTFALYWWTPYSGSNASMGLQIRPWLGQAMRYGLPFLAFLAVVAAAGLAGMRMRKSAVVAIVLVAGYPGLAQISRSFDVTWNRILLYLALLVMAWGVSRVRPGDKRLLAVLMGLGILLGVAAGTWDSRARRQVKRAGMLGGVTAFLETRIAETEPIGTISSNRQFLYYGKRLKRRVIPVPAEKKNRAQWLRMLRRQGVRYIAVGPNWQGRLKKESRWLMDPKMPFIRIFGENPRREPFIFRIEQSPSSAGGR